MGKLTKLDIVLIKLVKLHANLGKKRAKVLELRDKAGSEIQVQVWTNLANTYAEFMDEIADILEPTK